MERGPKPAREALPLVETAGGVNGRHDPRPQGYFLAAGAVEPVLAGATGPVSAAEARAGPDFT